MSASENGVRQQLVNAGLDRVAEQLASAALPALRLRTEQAEEVLIPIGSSKIGGRPDVSVDFAWPIWKGVPLSFLAQVDLAEISTFSCGSVLPPAGRLLFFYEAAQQTWGFDPHDRGSFAVVYSREPVEALVRHDWPAALPDEGRFGACTVELSEIVTLPPWESIYMEQLGLTEEETDRYLDLMEEMEAGKGDGMLHQLLGHPNPIQNEMQLECQLAANGVYVGDPEGYKDPRRAELERGALSWRLLFQLDSEETSGMMWGDLGRLYFWVRDEDLVNLRFEQAWMVLQCG